MAQLAVVLPYISAAGTILSTVSQISAGNQAAASAKFQAAQMEQQAGQTRASAQRDAISERYKAKLAGSRAAAVSAAGGGGVDDPTVVNILGDIEAQGEYNALSSLYSGEEQARGLETGATARRMEGKQAKTAGYIGAASTLVSGMAGNSLMQKYSPTGGGYNASGAGSLYSTNEIGRSTRGYY